jgi:virulence-associated protein VapD
MTTPNQEKRRGQLTELFGLTNSQQWPGGRMYAICFDLDQDALKRHYPSATHTNAYDDIRRVFERFGFNRQQGSVYFGNKNVTPINCVMAVQEMQRQNSWFGKVLTDIRMLRIEENNDLMPAIAQLELELPRLAEVRTE